jgi:hypothetical protein
MVNLTDLKWEKISKKEFLVSKAGVNIGFILKLKSRYWVICDTLVDPVPFLKLSESVKFLKSFGISL